MLANIRAQPLGPATVGELALPDDFLRRFADRVVRASFESNLRLVVNDAEPKSVAPSVEPQPRSAGSSSSNASDGGGRTSTWVYYVAGALGLLAVGVWMARRRSAA